MRLCELKGKTVINDTDCCILGFVIDIDFDPASGTIIASIHPDVYLQLLFQARQDYVVFLAEIMNMLFHSNVSAQSVLISYL